MADETVPRRRPGGKPGRKCPPKIQLPQRECVICKSTFSPQRAHHRYCSEKCRERQKELMSQLRNPSTVTSRGAERPFGQFECPVCHETFSATRWAQKYCSTKCGNLRQQRKWVDKNRQEGLCRACPTPTIPGTKSWCEKHWFSQAAARNGILGKGSGERVKKLLESQSHTCPYTGRKLVVGANASIDHKNPRSLFRDQVGLLENIEWVDLEVNRAKRALSKDEFISFCKLVASRFP